MRGDRGAAPRAPLGWPVPHVQRAPLVHDTQELPDVLEMRVGEGVVVLAPVHPLAEPDRAGDEVGGRLLHDLAALSGEGLEAVFLDLPLRVEAELLLDANLDPQALAVESVLVALVEAVHRLVAQEGVLQRPAPCRMHAENLVRGDRPVDEAEPRTPRVGGPDLGENVLSIPEIEDRELQRVSVWLVRQDREHGPESIALAHLHRLAPSPARARSGAPAPLTARNPPAQLTRLA